MVVVSAAVRRRSNRGAAVDGVAQGGGELGEDLDPGVEVGGAVVGVGHGDGAAGGGGDEVDFGDEGA